MLTQDPNLSMALAMLAKDARNGPAHIHAGVLYSQQKNYEKAAFHLQKAHQLDKTNPLILEKLCDVFFSNHEFLNARKYSRRLYSLNKKNPASLLLQAKVAEALGQIEDALTWIEKALEIEPENEKLLVEKASFLSVNGQIEQSLALHKRILASNPNCSDSWWPIAQLQVLKDEEAQSSLARIRNALENSVDAGQQRTLHYAAGKICNDIADYSGAFGHFEKANLLHDVDISADKTIATNINIRETYREGLISSKQVSTREGNDPIFIVGQTRSGTTLTESICASHSQISAGGELAYFADLAKKMNIYSATENAHRDSVSNWTAREIGQFAKHFHASTKKKLGSCKFLVDKLPHNFMYIGMIAIAFPNAKIIHCRRHPLDNCLSIFSNPMMDFHKEYQSTLETLGEQYRNYVQIMEYWKEVCPIKIHDVYYEDLVANTQAVSRELIDYLGMDWEDGVLSRAGSQKMVKTLSVWQVRQPVYQTSKGKWRHYEKHLAPLRASIGEYIEQYEAELEALDSKK